MKRINNAHLEKCITAVSRAINNESSPCDYDILLDVISILEDIQNKLSEKEKNNGI